MRLFESPPSVLFIARVTFPTNIHPCPLASLKSTPFSVTTTFPVGARKRL